MTVACSRLSCRLNSLTHFQGIYVLQPSAIGDRAKTLLVPASSSCVLYLEPSRSGWLQALNLSLALGHDCIGNVRQSFYINIESPSGYESAEEDKVEGVLHASCLTTPPMPSSSPLVTLKTPAP